MLAAVAKDIAKAATASLPASGLGEETGALADGGSGGCDASGTFAGDCWLCWGKYTAVVSGSPGPSWRKLSGVQLSCRATNEVETKGQAADGAETLNGRKADDSRGEPDVELDDIQAHGRPHSPPGQACSSDPSGACPVNIGVCCAGTGGGGVVDGARPYERGDGKQRGGAAQVCTLLVIETAYPVRRNGQEEEPVGRPCALMQLQPRPPPQKRAQSHLKWGSLPADAS